MYALAYTIYNFSNSNFFYTVIVFGDDYFFHREVRITRLDLKFVFSVYMVRRFLENFHRPYCVYLYNNSKHS